MPTPSSLLSSSALALALAVAVPAAVLAVGLVMLRSWSWSARSLRNGAVTLTALAAIYLVLAGASVVAGEGAHGAAVYAALGLGWAAYAAAAWRRTRRARASSAGARGHGVTVAPEQP